jgi:hypothetical protein
MLAATADACPSQEIMKSRKKNVLLVEFPRKKPWIKKQTSLVKLVLVL